MSVHNIYACLQGFFPARYIINDLATYYDSCNLRNVLCMPRLLYNLLSVSMNTEHRQTVNFGRANYQVLDEDMLVAVATKIGELWYLNCCSK